MNPQQHLLLEDAVLYARSSLTGLQGSIEGHIEATTDTLMGIERGLRDAADLVRQVRAGSEPAEEDAMEIGEEP